MRPDRKNYSVKPQWNYAVQVLLAYQLIFHMVRKCFRAADGAFMLFISNTSKGAVLMSTYEEFQTILTVALLIVAILTYTHKK